MHSNQTNVQGSPLSQPKSLPLYPPRQQLMCNTLLPQTEILKCINQHKEVCANGIYINSLRKEVYPCLNHSSNKVIEAISTCNYDFIVELMESNPESTCETLYRVFMHSLNRQCFIHDDTSELLKKAFITGIGFAEKTKPLFIRLIAQTKFIDLISRNIFGMFYSSLTEREIIEHIDYLVEIIMAIYADRHYEECKYPKITHRRAENLMLKKLLSHDRFSELHSVITHLTLSLKFVQLTDKEVLRQVECMIWKGKPDELTLMGCLYQYVMDKYNIYPASWCKDITKLPVSNTLHAQIYKYFNTLTSEFIAWLWNSDIVNKDNVLHTSSIYMLKDHQFQRLIDSGISFYDDNNKYYKLAKSINIDIASILIKRPEIRALCVDKE